MGASDDPEHLGQLARVGEYAGHIAGSEAAVALVTPEAEEGWWRESIAFDLGQARRTWRSQPRTAGSRRPLPALVHRERWE